MTIGKATIDKVKRLQSLWDEAKKIEEELMAQFGEYFECGCIDYFTVVDEPSGDYQQDGEYCLQYTGYIEDSGSGTYYYPSENPREYLAISYSF